MLQFKRIHLHLLVVSFLYTTAKAEWWDDFSNNLATDLAPLLALFGERVTMQFLSESTSWLDNFIFAMAPLGVVTAVVSAIRVCGGPGLRAFIGRAQEGGGIAEAELCSSTSRDVCELYHNGAIVRVFGRPKILEVVLDKKAKDFYHQLNNNHELQKPRCGIYTFREYVEETDAGKEEWEECGVADRTDCGSDLEQRGSSSDSGNHRITIWQRANLWCFKKLIKVLSGPIINQETGKRATFAPNPNLSFNIGIKKHRQCFPWLAAGAGLIMQASVILFGGLATYYWQWEKDDAHPQPWAFPLIAAGTILLSCGMFGCAYIVERSTKERTFYKHRPGDRSSVYIVQPGNQTIGDQTYDPFAFSDTTEEPLKHYITSWKVPDQQEDKIKVWFAMALTVIGFGIQFTGLRSMHSSVSVVLLAAILIMSIIRSALRTGRLQREKNLLHDSVDHVEHHELDWLAMKMGDGLSWSLSVMTTPYEDQSLTPERRHPKPYDDRDSNTSRDSALHTMGNGYQREAEGSSKHVVLLQNKKSDRGRHGHTLRAFTLQKEANIHGLEASKALAAAESSWLRKQEADRRGDDDRPCLASKLFHYRSRLAELTGQPTSTRKSSSSIDWDDHTVAVRQQAQQLKKAIEASVRILFTRAKLKPSWGDAKSLVWSLNVLATSQSSQRRDLEQVHIFLRKPDSNSGEEIATWEVDQNSLEAALGLSVWSILSDPTTEEPDGTGERLSVGAKVPRARILSLGTSDEALGLAATRLRYWAGNLSHLMIRRDLEHGNMRNLAYNDEKSDKSHPADQDPSSDRVYDYFGPQRGANTIWKIEKWETSRFFDRYC